LPGSTRVRFFSTTTALVRPWLKLCLTVEVSVFFSVRVNYRQHYHYSNAL
jgi:hypothetical protein